MTLDPQVAAKILPRTLDGYRRAARGFADWLVANDLRPSSAEEWDDLLAEWKACEHVTKTEFVRCLAALEYFFHHLKGKLLWAHQIVAGWEVAHAVRHTVPLPLDVCLLFAARLSADGHALLGAAMLVQQQLGLRPSEVLELDRHDVMPPTAERDTVVVGLGTRTNTKMKRPQAVLARRREEQAVDLLWRLWVLRKPGERLFPYTYEQYRRLLARTAARLGLDTLGYSPHSCRAGFATDARAAGRDFVDIREAGRWVSDKSLRTYIDLVTASAQAQGPLLAARAPAIAFVRLHWRRYFPDWALSHGAAAQAGAKR